MLGRKINFVGCVFLVLVCALYAHRANATDKMIEIAIPEIYSLSKQNEQGQWEGKLIDKLEKLGKDHDMVFKFRVVPFPRILVMLQAGATDLGVFISSPVRTKFSLRLHDLYETKYFLIARADSDIITAQDLAGRSFGLYAGTSSLRFAEQLPKTSIIEFNSHVGALKGLLADRTDSVIMPDYRFFETIGKINGSMTDFRIVQVLGSSQLALHASFQFREQYPALYTKIKDLSNVVVEKILWDAL